jgi:hypothetical protein
MLLRIAACAAWLFAWSICPGVDRGMLPYPGITVEVQQTAQHQPSAGWNRNVEPEANEFRIGHRPICAKFLPQKPAQPPAQMAGSRSQRDLKGNELIGRPRVAGLWSGCGLCPEQRDLGTAAAKGALVPTRRGGSLPSSIRAARVAAVHALA